MVCSLACGGDGDVWGGDEMLGDGVLGVLVE